MKRILPFLLSLLLLCACVQKPQTETAQAVATPSPEPDAPPSPDRDGPTPVALSFDVPEIKDYNDFVYTLSAALLDGTENRNLSPISVYYALAMAAEGADGQTLSDLLKLLGCSDLDALHETADAMLEKLTRPRETGEITLCNSLWTGEKIPVRDEFRKQLQKLYSADAFSVAFGIDVAAERISSWITEKTNGLISPSPDAMRFDEDTVGVLLNTVYFRDQWRMQFADSKPGTFTRADGTEQDADFLHRLFGDTYIVRGDGYLRYSVSFENRGCVTFILPDEGVALSGLLGTPDKLKTLLSGGETIHADVDLLMPEFKFRDRFELADTLTALGLSDAFTDDADFSGISIFKTKFDHVIQETVVDLNRNGVEAAGYTEILIAPGAAPMPDDEPEPLPLIEFHLDRPFLFVIETAGIPLFVGTVSAPGESR
jgi:serpin B